ncbi:NADH-quinone oxidoreductase subunit C [Streptomyces sp. NPDC006632]|uniref:NADH-quinone oxidoreductase subunit C n=1 Tax=Streptomyces sp. NPDC006632 TaxID=3157182 RepID=UPI0033A180AC
MNAYDTLPDGVTDVFGEQATAARAYGLLTVDVPADSWIAALQTARDQLGCTYFDWLSAVDEPDAGFQVCAHVVALADGTVRRLLLRTTVPHTAPALPSAIDVYAGAAWHERETHEMFGVEFAGHPHLVPLLLPENFEGHPLRKDFVLAARVAKAWPGAKEPGEPAAGAAHGGPKRRQMLPPGVPDPNEWGPLKGQLPPAPSRPARTPRAAGDRPARAAGERPVRAAGDRPVRRARTASEGSASQATEAAATTPATPDAGATPAGPANPATPDAGATPVTPGTEAAPGAGATPAGPANPATPDAGATPVTPGTEATPGAAEESGPGGAAARPRTRSSDAPWHHPKPAFADEGPEAEPAPDAGTGEAGPNEPAEQNEPAGPNEPAHPNDPAGGDPRE